MLYADLVAAIAAYTKRSDTGPLAPIWIGLTESRLNRELRHYRGLVRSDALICTEFTAPPPDFVALRSARLLDSPFWPIVCLSGEQMASRRAEQRTGPLDSMALIGGQLCVSPAPSVNTCIEMTYYASVPALSPTNTSNWVLANDPDLYLWGALAESANYFEDDEAMSKYGALFKDALAGANADSIKAEMGFNLSPSPTSRPI